MLRSKLLLDEPATSETLNTFTQLKGGAAICDGFFDKSNSYMHRTAEQANIEDWQDMKGNIEFTNNIMFCFIN